VFQELLYRSRREERRALIAEIKLALPLKQMGHLAKTTLPAVYAEMQNSLTGYGQRLFLKQIAAATGYETSRVDDVGSLLDTPDAVPLLWSDFDCCKVDHDLTDLPR
jgi:hypothetical protein